jgi:hypothetical protein
VRCGEDGCPGAGSVADPGRAQSRARNGQKESLSSAGKGWKADGRLGERCCLTTPHKLQGRGALGKSWPCAVQVS